jgi:hypothetical protein
LTYQVDPVPVVLGGSVVVEVVDVVDVDPVVVLLVGSVVVEVDGVVDVDPVTTRPG